MIKRGLLVTAAALVFTCNAASATELVSNGSFETGTFPGWTENIVGTPFVPWMISPVGAGSGFLIPTEPQDGTLDAWNGFDGEAGTVFTVYQDITIPPVLAGPAILTWKDRLQWDFVLTSSATLPRIYEVQIRNTSNAVLATLYSFSTGTDLVIGDSGWQSHSADLSAYAGSTVRLIYVESVPETFTGPGQFELDAVSLELATFVTVDSCNTGILDRPLNATLTLQQAVTALVDACTASARNHGGVVSCVTQGLNAVRGSLITGREKAAITRCTAQTTRRGRY